ncbi:hypothetical protein GCM10010840_02000 [Deinococcus aerolatus]|uniref:DUF4198 domain-containing protein n=1 Tax=Deinococcus aerolatus TaxID=522487 RepID=A0ABQ2FZQ0_9DEIO|nr:hypothetical protein [Deinococcus aerolatus]GGL67573.1 hypothetical protein GCM10010840_02000 [Deinococcus aerolatus]
MRKSTPLIALLTLVPLLSGPALAWVPQLEETVAKNVIDGAYGRRAPVPTYLTVDLNVKEGQFVAGPDTVRAFSGGQTCVAGWLAAPTDFSAGSRPTTLTVSGQADQLFFAAQDARDSFKNLTAKDALAAFAAGFLPSSDNSFGTVYVSKTEVTQSGTTTTATTTVTTEPKVASQTPSLANGELRIDVGVRGLPTELARNAYLVRLKGKDGALVAPVRSTYVNDFKKDGDTWSGTLVYYFAPLKAGLGAGDRVELLIKSEADTDCAYSVAVDLGKFQ